MTVGSLEIPMTYHAIAHTLGNNMCLIIDNAPATDQPAWLLTLPDGNYEQSWAAKSEAMDIEIAMNNAIATADSGTVNINTGEFTPTGGLKLDPTTDICYRLDRTSGRSVFATPSPGGGGDAPAAARLGPGLLAGRSGSGGAGGAPGAPEKKD